MNVRPEKVEEIKAVWSSPKFKTNNERLVHLFRHCRKPEHGYTIREFAAARTRPGSMLDRMWERDRKHSVFKTLRQMLRRFRKDAKNHEIILYAKYVAGKNYYYNMSYDPEGYEEVERRIAKMLLGITKSYDMDMDFLEMSETERRRRIDEALRKLKEEPEKEDRRSLRFIDDPPRRRKSRR